MRERLGIKMGRHKATSPLTWSFPQSKSASGNHKKNYRHKTTATLVIAAVALGLSYPMLASATAGTTEGYGFESQANFDSTFDLTTKTGTPSTDIVWDNDEGLGVSPGSGSVHINSSSGAKFGVLGSKTKYTMKDAPKGSEYSFTSFVRNEGTNGWTGMGFSANPQTADDIAAPLGLGNIYRPEDALGVSVAGTAFVFHVGNLDYAGYWNADGFTPKLENDAGIVAVKNSDCLQPVDATRTVARSSLCASESQWYKITVILKINSSDTFDLRLELYTLSTSDATGVANAEAAAIFELNGVANPTIRNSNLLSSYVNLSGHRFTRLDDYSVTLRNGATFVSAVLPVVSTTSATLTGKVVTLAGNVTSDNGSPITQRGFVYSTSPDPTINDSKIPVSGTTGSFTADTPSLAAGTYYIRAFATSSKGTSYGAEFSKEILASTPSAGGAASPPSAIPDAPQPSAVQISDADGALRISADPQKQENVSKYTIKLLPSGKSCEIVSPSRHCEITGVKPRTEYKVQITASNELGASKSVSLKTRVLLGPSGWLKLSSVKRVKNFEGDSARLGPQNKLRLERLAKILNKSQHVTCIGFSAGPVTSDRIFALATKRAKSACEKLAASKTEITFDLKSRVPGAKMIGANRKVSIRFYSPLQ